jgi:hypothetical protein
MIFSMSFTMQRRETSVLRGAAVVLLLAAVAACRGGDDPAPSAGSIAVSLSRPRVALGSPVEVTYRFTLAPDAPSIGDRRVFVHFLDGNDELMWTDDHDPPTPSSTWTPGQPVEYTRTMFVGRYPYVGAARVVAGLYSPETNERVKLSGEERGDRSYKVADFELLPQTENIFVIFKDGWHQTEVVAQGADRAEWQWMKKEATIAFRNPKRDVTLYLQADNPAESVNAARQLEVRIGEHQLGTVALGREPGTVERLPVTAAQLGDGDMVEIHFVAEKTFVPSLEPGAASGDTRELGARVFHAFVQ